MRYAKTSFVEKIKVTWGDPPSWVVVLAEEADRTSLREVGDRLGYSNAVISYVLSNKYTGDIERVEQKVRGALLGATVMCPVFGEFGRDRCLDEQQKGNTFTSESRGRCYRTCRGIGVPKCPHSRIPEGAR